MEQTFKLHERPSEQIKELRLLVDNENSGIYKLYTKWPGYSGLDTYYRVSYSPEKIEFIDFDGGPLISRGFMLDDNNQITDIYEDKNSYEFLVKVEKIN